MMIKNFASIIEQETLEQAKLVAQQPYIFKHVALMPDAHVGYGAPVGTVIATEDVLIPYSVGVDIGCGVTGFKMSTKWFDIADKDIKAFHAMVTERIPMGMGKNNFNENSAKEYIEKLECAKPKMLDDTWKKQLGTLGGGNHFIELCVDTKDYVWLVVHSGSRSAGKKVADYHQKLALLECKEKYRALPVKELAFFVEGERGFYNYLDDVAWCQLYAFYNRDLMLQKLVGMFTHALDNSAEILDEIRCHHNYVAYEKHYGKDSIIITRKGAINASKGVKGIIPGSMGTQTYVVEGKGNVESFCSAPHGAGRLFSRKEARSRFTKQEFDETMNGIIWDNDEDLIDEIPLCYKPISQVMEDSKPLVDVINVLSQKLNWKGK